MVTTPFDALAHVLDGSAEIKISGKAFELDTGGASQGAPCSESVDPLQNAADDGPQLI